VNVQLLAALICYCYSYRHGDGFFKPNHVKYFALSCELRVTSRKRNISVIDSTKVMYHLKITRNEICTKINILLKQYQISQTFKKALLLETDVQYLRKPFTSLKMKSIRHIFWIYFTAVIWTSWGSPSFSSPWNWWVYLGRNVIILYRMMRLNHERRNCTSHREVFWHRHPVLKIKQYVG